MSFCRFIKYIQALQKTPDAVLEDGFLAIMGSLQVLVLTFCKGVSVEEWFAMMKLGDGNEWNPVELLALNILGSPFRP